MAEAVIGRGNGRGDGVVVTRIGQFRGLRIVGIGSHNAGSIYRKNSGPVTVKNLPARVVVVFDGTTGAYAIAWIASLTETIGLFRQQAGGLVVSPSGGADRAG